MQNETSRAAPSHNIVRRVATRLRENRHTALIAFLFVLTFALHATAAARVVTFSDSGDFLMGITTVGNIHGPGYPLYIMTVKVFSWLVPFGSLAFRASLFSGIFASATACLIYWIVFRMARSRVAGVVAGLAYAFSYTFFYQTVIPETYSLNAFFIAILIVLALRWERMVTAGRRDTADNTLCLFALFFGLALANHFSILFLLPAFIFFAVDTSWRDVFAPRNLLRMSAFLVVGLLPYIYEPAAAFRGPAYNYGDPATLVRWFREITVYYQRGGLFNYPYRYLPSRFLRYFGTLTTEYPYFWWLGGLGFLASFGKRDKKYPLFLLFLFLLALLPIMTYTQIEPVLRAHFYYESYLVVSLWIGFGAAFLVRLVKRVAERADHLVEYSAVALVAVLVLLCPLSALVVHYDKVDKSNYFFARDMARDMLTTADRNSVIVVDDDNVIFPCMYVQIADKLRPDVRIVSAVSAGVPGFQGQDLLANIPPGYSANATDSRYVQIIERNYGRLPLYSTVSNIVRYNWKTYWLGFLLQVFPADSTQKPSKRGPSVLPGSTSESFKDSDARGAILLPSSLRANTLFAQKDFHGAEEIYDRIIPLFQHNIYVPTLYSCGTFVDLYELWGQVLNGQGKYQDTVDALPHASEIEPDFYSPSLARAYSAVGDYYNALSEFDKFLTFQRSDTEAWADLGEVYIKLKDYDKAASALQESLRLDPSNQRAHLLYARVLLIQGHKDEARSQFEKVIELDPSSDTAQFARDYLKRL